MLLLGAQQKSRKKPRGSKIAGPFWRMEQGKPIKREEKFRKIIIENCQRHYLTKKFKKVEITFFSYVHTRNLRDLLQTVADGVPVVLGTRQQIKWGTFSIESIFLNM